MDIKQLSETSTGKSVNLKLWPSKVHSGGTNYYSNELNQVGQRVYIQQQQQQLLNQIIFIAFPWKLSAILKSTVSLHSLGWDENLMWSIFHT